MTIEDITVLTLSFMIGVVYPIVLYYTCSLMYGGV